VILVGEDTAPPEYEALSRIFKEATGRELPPRPTLPKPKSPETPAPEGRSGITFEERWSPRILWLGLYRADLEEALEPIFRANGVENPFPMPQWLARFTVI